MKKGPKGPFTTQLSNGAGSYGTSFSIVWLHRVRERAAMSAPPRPANEYSRGSGASEGSAEGSGRRISRGYGGPRPGSWGALGAAISVAALLGAILLLV